jgi:hypothetical protein
LNDKDTSIAQFYKIHFIESIETTRARTTMSFVVNNHKRSYDELEAELLETKAKLAKVESLYQELQEKAPDKEDDTISDFDDEDDPNDPWTAKFLELRAHRIIHGDCKVPMKGAQSKLGKWVANQKLAYSNIKHNKKGKRISPERIIKMDGIGMCWGKAFPPPATWESRFAELEAFQKAMKHCNIPVCSTNPSELAKWVSVQRYEYKRFHKGRDSLLSLEQMGKLNDIGFSWKTPRV